MKTNIGKILVIAAGALLAFFTLIYLYTLLHEGGHAIAAIIYGGKIDSFVLGFDAHVTHSGTNFTRFGESLHDSAGILLPAIVLAVALKFYKRDVKYAIYHYIYAGISISITGSFIAWVAIPIISLFAVPPAGDDASKFLQVSGLHPLLVSLIALLLIILFTLYACKKGVYSKAIEYLRTLWQSKPSRFNKWQAIGLPAAILLLVAIAFAANQLLLPGKIFETSFTMNIHDNLKVMEMPFDVKTSRSYNMSLSLDAEGMLTDVRIFDDKGSMVYQNISEWFTLSSQVDLETGKHLLVLTFIRDPEAMVQYFEENKYTFSREQIDTFKALLAKKPNDKFIPVTFSAAIQ